ncbi:MAG TPA: alpha/beta hydrolase-fold protein, partial [Longimicrobiales bacterium]|nr:alpha/beta hydrolase-fold protein [Longimicrobiales bacterium]
TVTLAGGMRASYFVGPRFEPGRWTGVRRPRGGRRDSLLVSGHRVHVYLPPGTEEAREPGLLLTMDGGAFDTLVSTPATVESLVRSGTIPPVVVAMVEHLDRNRELPPNEGFVRFVADTLFPALRARYSLSTDPGRSAVAGSSLGGLAAAYLGYRLPHRFGNVIAQSGAYWWAPPGDDQGGWLFRRFAEGARRNLRVYLDAGILETQPVRGGVSMLRLTQHFRDVLCAKGYEVAYRTFPGGHEYEQWRATLPGALAWALGSGAGSEGSRPGRELGDGACERLVPGNVPERRESRAPSSAPRAGGFARDDRDIVGSAPRSASGARPAPGPGCAPASKARDRPTVHAGLHRILQCEVKR